MNKINAELNKLTGSKGKVVQPSASSLLDACSSNTTDGVQILQSGGKVYCSDGWIVSHCILYLVQSAIGIFSFAFVWFFQVFQRRFNGKVTFRSRTWKEYKEGFGDTNTEFWLGNAFPYEYFQHNLNKSIMLHQYDCNSFTWLVCND